MTNIAFIIDYLTLRSGGPRFLINVFNELSKKDYNIYVITGSADDNITQIGNNIKVINLNTYNQQTPPSEQPMNVMAVSYTHLTLPTN